MDGFVRQVHEAAAMVLVRREQERKGRGKMLGIIVSTDGNKASETSYMTSCKGKDRIQIFC